jgi:hypothetical protein
MATVEDSTRCIQELNGVVSNALEKPLVLRA